MSTVLPVAQPLAYGYQFYAFPLAIHANRPQTEDWVLSNYIHLAYDRRGQGCDVPFCFYLFDYAISPWLEVVRMTRSWVSRNNRDVREVIRDAISHGYYVYLIVDEFYLPGREPYQEWHFPHDILVHGYDDAAQTFTVLGFNQNFQFRTTEIPQATLVAAHASLDRQAVADTPFLFYRLLDEAVYEFRLDHVATSVEEYLAGANPSVHFQMLRQPWDRTYGIDVYGPLESFIRSHLARDHPYDIRNLHVLWEHKRLMVARIRRAARLRASLEKLIEPAEQIETMAVALRNGMIRDHLRGGGTRYHQTAVPLLHEIAQAERTLLTDFLTMVD